MKITQLEIQNFLTITETTLALDNKGLHLIQGINEDDSSASSNGAGKSSIVDAICWALYGVTARDVKGDAVVSLAAKKNCYVSISFHSGGQCYRATRYRKHSARKNALVLESMSEDWSVVRADLSKGTDAETQKELEALIGCSLEVFKAAVYCGQEAMADLPKMKDRELKTLIEEAAGMQLIEDCYLLARERNLAASSEFGKVSSKLDNLKEQISGTEDSLNHIKETEAAWLESRVERIAERQKIYAKAYSDLMDNEAKILKAKVMYETAKNRSLEIQAELAAHREKTAKLDEVRRKERTAEVAIDPENLKRLARVVKQLEDQIANPEAEIKKPCPECGTVLQTSSLEDFLAHKNKHLESAKQALDEGKKVTKERIAHWKKCKEVVAQLESATPDISELIVQSNYCRETIANYENLCKENKRLEADLKAADISVETAKSEKSPHEAIRIKSEEKIATLNESLNKTLEQFAQAKEQAAVTEAAVKVYGSAGVRAHILDTVTPFLNERTADYLSTLSDGEIQATWTTLTRTASGELREKFGIEVYHAKGGDSFAALSGGEKRKVRLATALALQDLVASRASNPIDLFVGDELDDALDPAGLERLMTVLERKARERGTVIIISHSDLRDWIDEVTTVKKIGQWKSVVEGSLCV